jgi:hypothetical protein
VSKKPFLLVNKEETVNEFITKIYESIFIFYQNNKNHENYNYILNLHYYQIVADLNKYLKVENFSEEHEILINYLKNSISDNNLTKEILGDSLPSFEQLKKFKEMGDLIK